MGVHNAEVFLNLGLCCYFSEQFDYVTPCIERAVDLATDENISDIWLNISQIAMVR